MEQFSLHFFLFFVKNKLTQSCYWLLFINNNNFIEEIFFNFLYWSLLGKVIIICLIFMVVLTSFSRNNTTLHFNLYQAFKQK